MKEPEQAAQGGTMRYIDKLISDLAKTIEECARLRGELVEKDAERDEVQAALDIRNEAFRASVEDDNRRREVLIAALRAQSEDKKVAGDDKE